MSDSHPPPRAVGAGGYINYHGGVQTCAPSPGNLPGPVAGQPTYGRRPGHRTAIARRGAGGEGPGGGVGRRVSLRGGRRPGCLLVPGSRCGPIRQVPYAAGFPAGSSLASPGASIYDRGVVCVRAATPIRSPTPCSVLSSLCVCIFLLWLLYIYQSGLRICV